MATNTGQYDRHLEPPDSFWKGDCPRCKGIDEESDDYDKDDLCKDCKDDIHYNI